MPDKKNSKLNNHTASCNNTPNVIQIKLPTSLPLKQHIQCYYEDKKLGLYLGIQEDSDLIKIRGDKFINIIKGSANIINNQTEKCEVMNEAGTFMIPKNYNGQWQPSTDLQSFYLVYNPPKAHASEAPIHKSIISFDEKKAIPWQITSDGYRKKIKYRSQDETLTAGIWQGQNFTTGIIAFPYNEFILLKSGKLTCTDTQEKIYQINAGEALFVPKGARCAWQTQEEITLYFVQVK